MFQDKFDTRKERKRGRKRREAGEQRAKHRPDGVRQISVLCILSVYQLLSRAGREVRRGFGAYSFLFFMTGSVFASFFHPSSCEHRPEVRSVAFLSGCLSSEIPVVKTCELSLILSLETLFCSRIQRPSILSRDSQLKTPVTQRHGTNRE